MCWISMFFRCCSLEELSLFAIDWKFWYLKTLQEPSCLYILHEYVKSRYFHCTDTLICKGSLERTLQEISKAKPCKQIEKQNVIVSSFALGWESRGLRNVDRLKSIGSLSKQSDSKGFVLIAPNCSEEQRLSWPVTRCLRLEASSGAASEKLSVLTMTFLLRGGISSTRLICLHSPNH